MATWSEYKLSVVCCRPHADLQCWVGSCVGAELQQYAQLVDSWRATKNHHAIATMSIQTELLPTGLSRRILTTIRRARSVCSASAFAMSSALPEVRDFRLRAVDGRLDGGAPSHTVHLQWETAAIGTVSKQQQQQHQESSC